MSMKTRRFLWVAHPARALLEAWLVGLVILFLLSLQVGHVDPVVLGNGLLFLCGICGMWAVLRTRVPEGGWLRQGAWELAVGFFLSLVMLPGIRLTGRVLGWEGVWMQSSFSSSGLVPLLLGTGPGYLVARGGVRLWLAWDRLRRRRLLWGLTHAHLTIVVVMAVAIALVSSLFLTFTPTSGTPTQSEAAGLLTLMAERLLHTLFPWMVMVVLMTGLALFLLLPPSALVSYFVARRTTRRLEMLAEATTSLSKGHYSRRVEVEGEDEVAQLQTDFKAMADDLQGTMRDLEVQRDTVSHLLQSRRELVASVSHELRTPIATMRATIESARSGQAEGALPPPLRHDLEVVEGEVLRLQRLIDDLFALSQLEVGGLALNCQPADVIPVVQRMLGALAPLAWNSGRVELVPKLPDGPLQAHVDVDRLQQALANLLRNAIRHTPPGGIVAVVVHEEPNSVAIEVHDTGEGIDPEDLPQIWERFYRSDSSRASDRGGAGLGLALVKEMTEAMGGSVSVESEVGQGSRFTVQFPKA
jgi:signal transduction histidine kinase